jgi:threonylcarbamoyladenosine tRNA methylthiotransferase MtaB
MRVGFHTFGCKLNQFETEALAYRFGSQGFSIVGADQDADLYVINTCTVTARADHKARAMIRGITRRRPDSAVIVTGCASQLEAEELGSLGRNVIPVRQSEKSILLELPRMNSVEPALLRAFLFENKAAPGNPFLFEANELHFHTRAFLKVQDGCDNRCAYCRVPLARGSSTSLELHDVLRRAKDLESRGYREIVITGVNISTYRSGEVRLDGLLRNLIDRPDSARLRLSSLEPEAVTEELAGVLSHPRICAHFHLPIQSGSDAILSRMRRRYTRSQIMNAAALLRGAKGDPFLAADVLVGFPGETADDYRLTKELVETVKFSALHVFPFSPRPGTPAFNLPDRVPERVRTERAEELRRLAMVLAESYGADWVGREVEVILEKGKNDLSPHRMGVSSNYLKVRVLGIPREACEPEGRIARVRILSIERAGRDRGTYTGAFLGYLERFFEFGGDRMYTLKS